MARSKEGKPREFYEGQIRSLKKENNYLRKRLKQLEHFIDEPEEKQVETSKVKVIDNQCPECRKGTLTEMEFSGRVFEVCFLCKYRKKIKALKKKR